MKGKTILAKRPSDELSKHSDNERFSHLCGTCWEPVSQPCILGIWRHNDSWQQQWIQCTWLIPKSYSVINRDKGHSCLHHFKSNEFMKGALKCRKCGYVQRIDLLDHENFNAYYYCFECKKEFKNLKQHYVKSHKKKGFEFERRPGRQK